MARFLSPEWFAELGHAAAPAARVAGPEAGTGPVADGQQVLVEPEVVIEPEAVIEPEVVIEIVVSEAPQGEVRYQVVVEQGRPTILAPGLSRWPSHVTLTTDYVTLSSMASGEVAPIDVLAAGKARISGDTGALSAHAQVLAGLDLLPEPVRSRTTF
jgi:hypothetical protein